MNDISQNIRLTKEGKDVLDTYRKMIKGAL